MKNQLPLENWADLLPFVPRCQLIEIVKPLGDRQFSSILQFFLTEVGQITIGYLRIVARRENDPDGCVGPIVEVRKEMPKFLYEWYPPPPSDLVTNLPEGPIPTNVRNFQLIELSYFDMSVANFLRQFQRAQQQGNFLLNNVNLWFPSSISLSPRDCNIIMPILVQLMSMIGNINSISMVHVTHIGFGSNLAGPNNAASQMLTTMLTNARILEIQICFSDDIPMCILWLYAVRDDGKPRGLRLPASFPNTCGLIGEIKKYDFTNATRPVSFFVCVRVFECGSTDWQDICMDNAQTNERLSIKTIDPPPMHPFDINIISAKKMVLISRYPMDANKEWIAANEQEIMECKFDDQNRRIRFERSLLLENEGNE